MRLSNPIEKPGFFWLPSNPDQHYPGNLSISEAGEISLRIVHRSTATDPWQLQSKTPIGDEPPLILGIVDSTSVTLQKCTAVNDPFYWWGIVEGGVSESRFRVAAAFIGAPFSDDEHILFSRVECSFESLSEWFSISGFTPEINSDPEPADWLLRYAQPNNIPVTLPSGIQLNFVFHPSFSLPDHKTSQLSSGISQQIHVSLEAEHPLAFVEYFDILHKIQTFLCLVMSKVTALEWVRGYSKDKLDRWNREIPTNIFYHSQLQGQPNNTHVPMLYRYSDMSEDFDTTILKWFESYETIQPAFDLYLSSKIGAHKYLTGIFLSLVQSLETLHRRTSDDTEMETDEFEQLHSVIIEATPPEKRDFVESSLEYANEISLGRRLKQLIRPFRDVFGTSSEVKSFVRKIVVVRNYLTHYDKAAESEAKQIIERDLYDICLKIDALLQLQFLLFTGMDVDRIRSMAKKNHLFRHRLALNESDT
ncbi:MAG: hypothetical protein OXL41_02410 [Nitrospinae bacterium]|nr:hypothetical protein [Nitrospinota bacterium]